MAEPAKVDKRFGDIAIDMGLLSHEKLDRALVVQKLIFSRTNIHMAIGKVLKEMGALTQKQIDSILEAQDYLASQGDKCTDGCQASPADDNTDGETKFRGLSLTMPKDKLSAFIAPNEHPPEGLTLEAVKAFLEQRGVVHGLVDDQTLTAYLAQDKLPMDPFKVAAGVPPISGHPPEIIYHFDTDPLRIGTLKEDGTMDWKDRGEIPQAKAGDMLVEKTEGNPGKPGTTVYGKELPPPRMRNPKLKAGKGTQRSEDGRQILAKVDGTPKLSSDGKVYVFGVLNIDGDIGVETGHIEYEGYVETTGGVNSGYVVKGKGLRTSEIQDATIEAEEDLVCYGGIYGSTIKVGGNMKASHIHNCTIEVLGELVVEKEIYDSTIETNGRLLIVDGKLIATKIDAKKGVYAKEIGSQGSMPCNLTVGFDRKFERDLAGYKDEKNELEHQQTEAEATLPQINKLLETLNGEQAAIAREMESYVLQKRQFEEQLRGEGPNAVDPEDEEARLMLEEMIAELAQPIETFEAKASAMQDKQAQARERLAGIEERLGQLAEQIESVKGKIEALELSQKVDPGIPVVKANGTIYNKTKIIGPHKEIIIPQDMHQVRIGEAKAESAGNRYKMKISNLR